MHLHLCIYIYDIGRRCHLWLQSKMFLGDKGKRSLFTIDAVAVDIAQFSAHAQVAWREVCTCFALVGNQCTCFFSQERELLMLPGTPVRISSPGRNMGNKLWEFSLCVDDESEQMIDFKHPQWGHAKAAKSASGAQVCAAACRLTRMRVLRTTD